ncbi:MAG: cation diffusion facilitator family transporter [Culicoidibacterales bacterium]
MRQISKSELGIALSFIMYSIATSLKLTFGFLFQSAALLADGLNSLSDVIATIIIFIGVRVAKKPDDANHHYGHQRYEQIASIIAVVVMMFAGFEAIRQGFFKMLNPAVVDMNIIGVFVSIIAACVVMVSGLANWSIYKKTKAMANKVIFYDNLGDALVSLLTAVALLFVVFHFYFADGIASVLIGFVIIKSSYGLLLEAAHQLSDGFDEQVAKKYTELVSSVEGVLSVTQLRGRIHGIHHYIELTIEVDELLSLVDAHLIAERVERCLLEETDTAEVIVHYEPMGSYEKTGNFNEIERGIMN